MQRVRRMQSAAYFSAKKLTCTEALIDRNAHINARKRDIVLPLPGEGENHRRIKQEEH